MLHVASDTRSACLPPGVFCTACAPKDAIEMLTPLTGKLSKERGCAACVEKFVKGRAAVGMDVEGITQWSSRAAAAK